MLIWESALRVFASDGDLSVDPCVCPLPLTPHTTIPSYHWSSPALSSDPLTLFGMLISVPLIQRPYVVSTTISNFHFLVSLSGIPQDEMDSYPEKHETI